MGFNIAVSVLFASSAFAGIVKRDPGFPDGQPNDGNCKGAIFSGGTNHQIDIEILQIWVNRARMLGLIYPGGWVREQADGDLPSSHDIAGAQQHLKKGAIRELHWHRVAEWGQVFAGRVLISTFNENGEVQNTNLDFGDIWYFPKGQPHIIQGLEDENEYLLAFDDGDFDRPGTTFNLMDWLSKTPKYILAKSFGLPVSTFDKLPTGSPYILNSSSGSPSTPTTTEDPTYIYRTFKHAPEPAPGGAGKWWKTDSTNFPITKTIASTYVVIEPKGIRELHWHPTSEEWLYFHEGHARATAFIGNGNARTFDFGPGDAAVFPDNAAHYIEKTSETQNLTYIEIYKADRVADISLTQMLALSPSDVVADITKLPIDVVEHLKKDKQVLVHAQ